MSHFKSGAAVAAKSMAATVILGPFVHNAVARALDSAAHVYVGSVEIIVFAIGVPA